MGLRNLVLVFFFCIIALGCQNEWAVQNQPVNTSMALDSPKMVRGSIFYFTADPGLSTNPVEAYQYFEDGGLVLRDDGYILDVGPYSLMQSKYQFESYEIKDYSGRLIIPGFIDTHIHYPQSEMIAAYGEQLLQWLENYTFPTEAQFKNKDYARSVSRFFLNELLRNGTTTALVFGTVHKTSVEALFEEAEKLNMRIIGGKVLMDRNAPAYLLDTPETAFSESRELIETWHNRKGRILYAITPRFAITSTPEELKIAGKLYQAYPDVYLHTHVSENLAEVAFAKQLFPNAQSYLYIYNDFGLVGPRSVFAHGIHLSDTEFSLLAETQAAVAFCPTSNLFLGSGLFNFKKAQQTNIHLGLGTDVGAGTSFSLLQTMNEAYKVVQMHKADTETPEKEVTLTAFKAFYLATLGGARALHLDDKLGSLQPGKEADFIVLNPNATPLLSFRIPKTTSLAEQLFVLMMLADDRVVEAVYLMGRRWVETTKDKP